MKAFIVLSLIITIVTGVFLFNKQNTLSSQEEVVAITEPNVQTPYPTPTINVPTSKLLNNDYQIFQSFNNCGPASLSMALSYYNIHKSQEELGQLLRPYQIPGGDNDDKSVTLDELASQAETLGLVAYHRPNGNIELLQKFISSGIPVITRTWLHPNEDIGHYRVIKGYDQIAQEIIQDDSFEGHNLHYSDQIFNSMWQKYNYEYLVIVPQDKQMLAEQIIAENTDPKVAWQNAVKLSQQALEKDPDSIYDRFNLSVAYHNIGEYQKSVEEYQKVADKLPFRTLWYQLEPVDSFYQIGDYQSVFQITDKILNNQNRAYSEAYLLRGQSYLKQNQPSLAKTEFEKALLYNKNSQTAQKAANSL